jgi:hypothetical protein
MIQKLFQFLVVRQEIAIDRSQNVMQSYAPPLFGTYAISVLHEPEASGMILVYRYSSIMDGKEVAALTGNGSPQRSRPRRVMASEANLSLS